MTGTTARRRRPVFVSIRIHAPVDRVWELTQEPALHARWDARFSRITPTEPLPGGGIRFVYERRISGARLSGTGTTIGERDRRDGTRTSALRFDADSRLSPLGRGRGYWRYRPDGDHVVFTTGYDYEPNWGRSADLIVRPLIGWLTAWSFDRLRLWAETGTPPERWPLRCALAMWRRDRPHAARCDRRPSSRRIMDAAPRTLSGLVHP
ncbi:SRPBCC family protein [Microbacterium sp. SSM24]|uniref:SRPBCC family protein n=1 Tax=Microbacterium sp. SSM24 TaxID=2991714 RepID=UPI0022271286|nr:SRPBCC family protein [Microbacterium sp. SSM24]MCW3493681.1 SRPBCC family protein [Microbacterium sp. SSM24]